MCGCWCVTLLHIFYDDVVGRGVTTTPELYSTCAAQRLVMKCLNLGLTSVMTIMPMCKFNLLGLPPCLKGVINIKHHRENGFCGVRPYVGWFHWDNIQCAGKFKRTPPYRTIQQAGQNVRNKQQGATLYGRQDGNNICIIPVYVPQYNKQPASSNPVYNSTWPSLASYVQYCKQGTHNQQEEEREEWWSEESATSQASIIIA